MMAPRVLVVEDNQVNLELIEALLDQEGCQVLAAETADVGLRLAASEHPDFIVMDVQLPGMTGYEVTRHLKTDPITSAIPVIVVTAHAMRGEEAKARAAGCDAYLTKPLDTQAFRDVVRRLLRDSGGAG